LTGWTAEEQQEVGEEKKTRRLWPLTTPCAVIERASCPDQRVIRTTLRFVVEAIEQEGSRPPGLLVVGRACETLYTPEKGRSWVVEDGFRCLDLGVEAAGLGAAAGAMMGIAGMA
jgi:uroporphyrin-III C-methyltransferase